MTAHIFALDDAKAQGVVALFGAFLIFQGLSVLRGKEPEIHPENNRLLHVLRRVLPLTPKLDGQRFFTRENGKLLATPLFLALVFIEVTDIMFAFDSVPAIFGLTKEPLVVFTSNIFAVIDLRALYFLLAGVMDLFRFLNYGLSAVLVFVGVKMIAEWARHQEWLAAQGGWDAHGEGHLVPPWLSLLIVVGLIGTSVAASLAFPGTDEGHGTRDEVAGGQGDDSGDATA